MSLCFDEQIGFVELDIDGRMLELWEVLLSKEFPADVVAAFAPFMRAAFAQGYYQAHTDPVPGYMYRTHGFSTPPRQRA